MPVAWNISCKPYAQLVNRMLNRHDRSWQGNTVEDFMQQIEAYMVWYRDPRIKISLGDLSPAEYRIKMGLAISSNKMSAGPYQH
jgi:transposase InsO family protein